MAGLVFNSLLRAMAGPVMALMTALLLNGVQGEQLRSAVSALHYNVTLLPVLENPRLCGHVSMDFKSLDELYSMAMHVANMTIVDVSIASVDSPAEDPRARTEEVCFEALLQPFADRHSTHSIRVQWYTVDRQREIVSLHFSEPLSRGGLYRISMYYLAQMSDDHRGFFRLSYVPDGQCAKRWIGATAMEPAYARGVFPCLDEPEHKAAFEITVGHHRSQRAISNMPRRSTVPMAKTDDWLWSRFYRTPVMSTYLLAVVVSDYVYVERKYVVCQRSVTMRFWSAPGRLEQVDFIVNLAPKMLRFLENYFKMAFTLPKIDFIALPQIDFFSAMENWGLIVFKEEYYLIDEAKSSELQRFQVANSLAHEFAHCWFGNLVTFRWWDDLWFTEGFTTYFAHIIVQSVTPQFRRIAEERWNIGYAGVISFDDVDIQASHPVSNDLSVLQPNDIKFDIILYYKAAILMKMLNSFVGDATLRSALIEFMNRYQYLNANSTQFWEILTKQMYDGPNMSNLPANTSIDTVMEAWVHRSGYPVVKCYRTNVTGQIILIQKPSTTVDVNHSTGAGNVTSDSNSTLWWIPITLTTPTGDSQLPPLWLSPEQPVISVSLPIDNATWILVDPQLNGYYRVEYDELNWQLLANQLVANHTAIPAAVRFQLIEDAFRLVWAEIIPVRIALQLIRYLRWVQDDPFREITLNYVIELKNVVENPAEILELEEHIAILSSPAVVVSSRSSQVCVDPVGYLYRSLIDNSISGADNKLMLEQFEEVWCTAMRYGGDEEWNFAWRSIDDPSYGAAKVVRAMACSRSQPRLRKLLMRIFRPSIHQSREVTSTIIASLAQNPVSRSMTIDFLIINWQFLTRHFNRPALRELAIVSKHLRSGKDQEKAMRFIEQLPISQQQSAHLSESIQHSIRLKDNRRL